MAKVHLLGLGEHRTVSNVPGLPALSLEVQQELGLGLGDLMQIWNILLYFPLSDTLGGWYDVIVGEKSLLVMECNE
jgi:hypothetical protein